MNRSGKMILWAAVPLLLLWLLSACGGEPSAGADSEDGLLYYDMEFHRGGRDARPENTLYAYQYALENGASVIECDMQLTADGEIVLSHNPTLNPVLTTDADGDRVEADRYDIPAMSLAEVQSFNVGRMIDSGEYYELHGRTQVQADASIPSLRQLFQLVKDSGNRTVRISAEAKYQADPAVGRAYELNPDKDALLEAFLRLVKEFGLERRVVLQAFDWDFLVRMESLAPEIETMALYSEQPSWGSADATTLWLDRDEPSPWLAGADIRDFDGDPVKAAHSLGIDGVSPYYEEITKEQVDEAHSFGMRVVPWTVNSREDMERLYDMGADGMISDKPWVLREFLEEKGEPLPPIARVDQPWHLEPDHYEAEAAATDGGRDAAY